jgi:hypothetical protein
VDFLVCLDNLVKKVILGFLESQVQLDLHWTVSLVTEVSLAVLVSLVQQD